MTNFSEAKITGLDISLPDFRTWAENIITMARQFGTAQNEIERALEQAFNQGRVLERRRRLYEIDSVRRR
jgi:hypothetical protein